MEASCDDSGKLIQFWSFMKRLWDIPASVLLFVANIVQIKKLILGEPSWVWLLIFILSLTAACTFVFIRKKDIGKRFGHTHVVHMYPLWLRIFSLGVLFATFLVIAFGSYKLFGHSDNEFRVLIADMDGPPEYGVSEVTIEKLRKATRKYPDIRIIALGEKITVQQGEDTALRTGRKFRCDLVIWGWYRKANERILLNLNFVNLISKPLLLEDKGGMKRLVKATDLENFTVQEQFGSELTSLAFFLAGFSKYAKSDYSNALLYFNEALSQVETNNINMLSKAYLRYYRADSSMVLRTNIQAAYEDLCAVIQEVPSFLPAYVKRSCLYQWSRKYEQGLQDCAYILEKDPANLAGLILRVGHLYYSGKHDEALNRCYEALIIHPRSETLHYLLGMLHQEKGEFQKALGQYNTALTLNPEYAIVYTARGRVLSFNGDFAQALNNYNMSIKLFPENPDAYLHRAVAYCLIKNVELAVSDLSTAICLLNSFGDAYVLRGNIYLDQGKYSNAIADLNMALNNTTNYPQVYKLRAKAYCLIHNYTKAILDYEHAVQYETNNADIYYCFGKTWFEIGNLTNATKYYTAAIQCSNTYSAAYYARGMIACNQNRYQDAISDLSNAIKYSDSKDTNAIHNRGVAYLSILDFTNAIRDFSKSIELTPYDATPYYLRGSIYAKWHIYSNAINDCLKAISLTNRMDIVQKAQTLLDAIKTGKEVRIVIE